MKLLKFKRLFSITILMIMLLVPVMSISTEATSSSKGTVVSIRPVFGVGNPLKALFDPLGAIRDLITSMIDPIQRAPINRMQSALLEDSHMATYLEYGKDSPKDAAQNRMQRWFDIFELAGLAFMPLVVLRAAVLLIGSFASPSDRAEVKEFIKNVILYFAILLFAKDVILWLVQINDAIVALFNQASQQSIMPPGIDFKNMTLPALIAYLFVILGTWLLSLYIWVLMFIRKVVIGLAYALIPVAAIMIFSSKFRSVFKTLYDEVMSAVFQQAIYAGTYVILYDLLVYILAIANGDLGKAALGKTDDLWGGWLTKNVPVEYVSGNKGSLTVLEPLGWLILMFLLLHVAKKVVGLFSLDSKFVPETGEIIKGAVEHGGLAAVGIAGLTGIGTAALGGVAFGGGLEKATKWAGEKFTEKGKYGKVLSAFGERSKGWNKKMGEYRKKSFGGKLLYPFGAGYNFAKDKGLHALPLTMAGLGGTKGILGGMLMTKSDPAKQYYKKKLEQMNAKDGDNDKQNTAEPGDLISEKDKNDMEIDEWGQFKTNGKGIYAKKVGVDKDGKEEFDFYKRNDKTGNLEKMSQKEIDRGNLSETASEWATYGGSKENFYSNGDGTYFVKSIGYHQQAKVALNSKFETAEPSVQVEVGRVKNISEVLGSQLEKINGEGFIHLEGNVAKVTQFDVKTGEQKLVGTVSLNEAQVSDLSSQLNFNTSATPQTAAIKMQGRTFSLMGEFSNSDTYDMVGLTDANINASDNQLREMRNAAEKAKQEAQAALEGAREELAQAVSGGGDAQVASDKVQRLEFTIDRSSQVFEAAGSMLDIRKDMKSMTQNSYSDSIADVDMLDLTSTQSTAIDTSVSILREWAEKEKELMKAVEESKNLQKEISQSVRNGDMNAANTATSNYSAKQQEVKRLQEEIKELKARYRESARNS